MSEGQEQIHRGFLLENHIDGAAPMHVDVPLFAFLALLRLHLDNIATELVSQVNYSPLTAGLAIKQNASILDIDVCLGILAGFAKDELVDETIKMVLKLRRFVGAVDDPAVICRVGVGLCTQLKAEVLDHVSGRAGQGLRDTAEVCNDSFDAVALALNFGLQALHLVAVERVGDILLISVSRM